MMSARDQAEVPRPVTFEDLLAAVGKSRDRDAFIRLFEHFAPRLKSFLMKGGLTPEQADDLAQDTMLTVWDRAPSYDPRKAGASTWIFTIARNRRIDVQRRMKWHEPDPEDPLLRAVDENNLPPDIQASNAQDMKAVAAALSTLPPEQAELIRKAFYEEKSHSAIAAETSLPLGTVKSRLRTAMEHMRQTLTKRTAS